MKNIFLFLIIAFIFSSCNLKKIESTHGVRFLDKKQEKLTTNKSNKNDILKLLGSPSTKSTFDNDLWIYIETTTKKNTILNFGKDKIIKNNVLLLEINNRGLLEEKRFLSLIDMQNIKFIEQETETQLSKNTFVYNFLTSLRQKINNPLGNNKRKK
jgi:outer membrane protein assembly factor BamE (lipoprotein component of BamABCDE complex)|tara:strand:+ start:114 stop:581 length:468 start_codon:yes stop_codon:yes gene_type:complete